ncbi:MAG TPA: DUF2490 domain-containing protein [Pyrinomonadaceae bacterium]|nr:DUF2490 domain-containing protein [Pyrinomonadaceae bacterium]
MRISLPENRLTLRFLALVALLLASGLSKAPAQARPPVPEEDTQLWNDLQVAVAVTDQVDFNLFGTFRFGRDVSHLVDRRAGVGFSYRAGQLVRQPADFLSLAAWYMSVITRPTEGRKAHENRLHFAATVRFPVGKVALSDRNLFERRLRTPVNFTRYRNRLQLDYPARLKDGQFGVFVSDEVFYDWSVDEWVRNRFTAGVTRRFNRHFAGDLYYMRQNDARSRPGDLHVIGLAYRVRL